ncbi:hypothetical protein NIES970_28900 (plasmid) [[Synechococcus] sp. NIES-970]|nr:hypothetical protein NIES970_28900 [[Synechococcus] sp. NIES-970]
MLVMNMVAVKPLLQTMDNAIHSFRLNQVGVISPYLI